MKTPHLTNRILTGWLIFFSTCLLNPTSLYAQCNGTLVWQDEFNTGSLDMTKWNYQTGDGCPSLCGWGNSEMEYYTTSTNNVRVTGGNLVLEARSQTMGSSSFTSGKILTKGLHYWTYGRMEARIQMPAGSGLWPAFWMLPEVNNWPMTGEIDITEYRGDMTTRTSGTLHYGNPWPNNQYDGTDYYHSASLASGFHVYAVEWEANEIRWYFDDRLFKIVTRTPNTLNPVNNNAGAQWPWTTNFHIILNLAVGGWFTGVTTPGGVALTKPTMEVDYVRVYNMASAAGTQSPFSGTPAAIPGTIQAEEYDRGCGEAAYYDTDLPNTGGQFRGERVDIENCTDAGAGYNVGWINTGEWLEYTVNVTTSATYDIALRTASQTGGGQVRIEVDGVDLTGTINLPNTGGWQTWQNTSVTNRTMTPGNHIIRLYVITGGFNFNYMNFTVNTVLPAGYLSFTGTRRTSDVLLEWTTATEQDNLKFHIERSTNAISWTTLGEVAGSGTTSSPEDYSFIDISPLSVVAYYRLRQEDINGNFTYSGIISVSPTVTTDIIYPNPFTNGFYVDQPIEIIEVYDYTGRLLQTFKPAGNSIPSRMGDDLTPGIYLIRIYAGNNVKSFSIIKK